MGLPIDVKAAILQVLVEGEAFGLEVIQRIEERTKGKLLLAQGTVYPALRDLEREGLLRASEGKPLPQRGGRPRTYYRLTAAGMRAASSNQRVVRNLFLLPVRA
jgi:PadR family transcriptional regulator PadR